MRTFWNLVQNAALVRPREVLVSDDYGRSLTTAQFCDAAEKVAAGLLQTGLNIPGVMSWQLPTSLEAVLMLAACARLGVTQNPIIPVLRRREVEFIVRQARTSLLVVPKSWRGFDHSEMARSLGVDVLELEMGRPVGGALRLPLGDPAELPSAPAESADCRWIYYTSGTTADPKGVRHSDASVIASSNGVVDQIGMKTGDVYPIAWPFAHIGGVSMLSSALRVGGTLVLFDTFDASTTPGRMALHSPTLLGSATPFFHSYIAAQRAAGSTSLFPRLRACVAGGAPTPESVNRETAEVLGVRGVVGAWGLTEFPVASSETPDDEDLGSTVGRLTSGVEIRVVEGELRLRGPQQFLGYVDASLDPDAFDADGWFRTGDLGTIGEDDRIRIVGRLKDIIIRNAENISAQEIEEVLFLHPDVADAAVVGVPHPRTGEEVWAFVVLRPDANCSVDAVMEHCAAQGLAPYKRPTTLRFVEGLPRNSMGKVVKATLRTWAAPTEDAIRG